MSGSKYTCVACSDDHGDDGRNHQYLHETLKKPWILHQQQHYNLMNGRSTWPWRQMPTYRLRTLVNCKRPEMRGVVLSFVQRVTNRAVQRKTAVELVLTKTQPLGEDFRSQSVLYLEHVWPSIRSDLPAQFTSSNCVPQRKIELSTKYCRYYGANTTKRYNK